MATKNFWLDISEETAVMSALSLSSVNEFRRRDKKTSADGTRGRVAVDAVAVEGAMMRAVLGSAARAVAEVALAVVRCRSSISCRKTLLGAKSCTDKGFRVIGEIV